MADIVYEISKTDWSWKEKVVTVGANGGSSMKGGNGGGTDHGTATAVSVRALQKICPESYAALGRVNISSSCGDLHAAIGSFKGRRAQGIWAMYEKGAACTEAMIGATLETTGQQWCLAALRLADEPISKEGF